MDVYDLDAVRAARQEALGERPVKFGGETFAFPPELPLAFVELLVEGKLRAACSVLVGDGQIERFWSCAPTAGDLSAISSMYGVDVGEAAPSSPPSNRAGRRSRATSNGGTGSTSGAAVGGPKPLAPAVS